MIEKIMQDIKNDYSEKKVLEDLDEEILNWAGPHWEEDGYENQYEWYAEFNNKEAEAAIIEQLINHWVHKYNNSKELDDDLYNDVYDKIRHTYYPLGRG